MLPYADEGVNAAELRQAAVAAGAGGLCRFGGFMSFHCTNSPYSICYYSIIRQ
jgi:hypothetical protein